MVTYDGAGTLRKYAYSNTLKILPPKNGNFSHKKFRHFFIFLLKTLIVGTSLNRLGEAFLTSTHNLCFGAKIRKIMYTPVNPSFTI